MTKSENRMTNQFRNPNDERQAGRARRACLASPDPPPPRLRRAAPGEGWQGEGRNGVRQAGNRTPARRAPLKEQGPQRGPTANRDPTGPIQPRGTQEHFASSTTTAYPGLTCSAGVYPPRKTPYIPRPRGMNPRATEPDAKCSKPCGAGGRIAEENGGCQWGKTSDGVTG